MRVLSLSPSQKKERKKEVHFITISVFIVADFRKRECVQSRRIKVQRSIAMRVEIESPEGERRERIRSQRRRSIEESSKAGLKTLLRRQSRI